MQQMILDFQDNKQISFGVGIQDLAVHHCVHQSRLVSGKIFRKGIKVTKGT
jgi:hypothetical protein